MTLLAAATVDPAPITAWLTLVLVAIGIVAGVVAGIAFFWRLVALPQVTALVHARTDQVAAVHKAEHDDLDERLDAESKARSTAISKVHARIDAVHLRVDGIAQP